MLFFVRFHAAFLTAFLLAASADVARAETAPSSTPPATIEEAIAGAHVIGKGAITAYAKGESTLLELPTGAFGRLFLWYAEAVRLPTSVVVDSLEIGKLVARLERRGGRVLVRNLTSTYDKRAGVNVEVPGADEKTPLDQPKLGQPIDAAVESGNLGPIIAVLPVVAESPDGKVLVDVTAAFSSDVESLSARSMVMAAGLLPSDLDPARSYISEVRVFPTNIAVRSHLTFLATDPANAASAPIGVSVEIGHSLVLLPEKPMASRAFDGRVGFFHSKFIEFETFEGEVEQWQSVISRHRLEKKDRDAEVSEPIRPITFYISREVPDRWRPYIKAGVEQWRPVFEAAGFRNAIVAADAPSKQEDPNWTEEDASLNIIRWLAQPIPDAMGPAVIDPRSGEILSSHIHVWPQIISFFQYYYYAVHSSLDPEARKLPFSDKKRGELLQYVIAHEVGHAVGLRHNHLASTAYTVAQMRNPEFANRYGASSSIMAYGRFNQAAQPDDGVTKLISDIGPYDYFAIKWGYGVFGKTAAEEKTTLDRLAAEAQKDRQLIWAAGETPDEKQLWKFDPRVQMENTGAGRIEATKLGVANVLRSLGSVDEAAGQKPEQFGAAYGQMMEIQLGFLESVIRLVGGVMPEPRGTDGPRFRLVPAAEQRAAVQYLLGDGVKSLEPYKRPEIVSRVELIGGIRAVEIKQQEIVNKLLDPTIIVMLEGQTEIDPKAYGLSDFTSDVENAIWGDLSAAPRWRRALQRAYLAKIEVVLKTETVDPEKRKADVETLQGAGVSAAFAEFAYTPIGETSFPAWARSTLPDLAERLDRAATEAKSRDDALHFMAMAQHARRIAVPQQR